MNNTVKVIYDKEKKHYRIEGNRIVEHMFNYTELFSAKGDEEFFDSIKKELLKPTYFRIHYKTRHIKGLCTKILREYLHELSKELITGKTYRAPVANYFQIGIGYYSDSELKVSRQKGLLQKFDLFGLNYKVPYIEFRVMDRKQNAKRKRVGIHKDLYKEFIDNVNNGRLETGYIDNQVLYERVAKIYEGLLEFDTVKRIIKKSLNKIGFWTGTRSFDLRFTNPQYYFTICGSNYTLLHARPTKLRQWAVKYRMTNKNVHMYIRVNPKKAVEYTQAMYEGNLKLDKLWIYNGLIPVLVPDTYIWRITISREELIKRFKVIKNDPFKNINFCLENVTLTAKEVAIINTENLYFSEKEKERYYKQIKEAKKYVS